MSPLSPSRIAAAATLAGAALLVLGAQLAPQRTAFAYLFAFAFCWSIGVGALALVLIHHLTDSSWFIVLRRVAETLFAPLVLLAALFLPVWGSLDLLYPWVPPLTDLPHALREEILKKDAYLNEGFFAARAVLYFAVWIATAQLLRRASLGPGDPVRRAHRQRVVSAAAVFPFALACYFASVDWLMSLEPGWVSSVFGVYVFAGGLCAALALVILVAHLRQRRGALRGDVRVSHYHGAGKLLLAFVCFWSYLAYFQYMLIWIADLPSEVGWYVARTSGSFAPLAVALPLLHFALPFAALLSRELKRRSSRLAGVAALVLVAHALDVYWIVLPAIRPAPWAPHWVDLGALLGVTGAVALYALWRGARDPATAHDDPRYAASLGFETR